MRTLRPYQTNDLSGIRALFAKGHRKVIHVLPPGCGKTVEFAEMIRLAQGRGTRTCILTHRDSLMTQASNKLKDAGVKHGIIAPGHKFYGDKVHIASVQTLVRRLDRLGADGLPLYNFDFMIPDEAHHCVAPTYTKIFNHFDKINEKLRVLGVTATPILGNGRGLDGVFQAMHLGIAIDEAIREGYLTAPDTYGPKKVLDLSGVKTSGSDYDRTQLAAHMDSPRITGDAVEHYSQLCPGKAAIVFCVKIKHAEDTAAAFKAAGFRSEVIHGKMPLELIRYRIAALTTGEIQVLVSCDLVSEGTDIPAVICAIGLRPTKSLGLNIQQYTRALRPIYADGYDLETREGRLAAIAAGPKPRAIILDHAANCFIHKMTVDEPVDWTLAGKKRGKKGGPTMILTQCPKCLRPHKPAPKCPHINADGTPCGHIYVAAAPRDPDMVGGTLEKVDKMALRRARWSEERKCKTLEDLIELGRKRKYQYPKKWAEIRWGFMHPKKDTPATEEEMFS